MGGGKWGWVDLTGVDARRFSSGQACASSVGDPGLFPCHTWLYHSINMVIGGCHAQCFVGSVLGLVSWVSVYCDLYTAVGEENKFDFMTAVQAHSSVLGLVGWVSVYYDQYTVAGEESKFDFMTAVQAHSSVLGLVGL